MKIQNTRLVGGTIRSALNLTDFFGNGINSVPVTSNQANILTGTSNNSITVNSVTGTIFFNTAPVLIPISRIA